ncbi:CxxxxCH/CxxCH domain c-type cytochrome [Geopsychrobacter electrodiphilus]|uniref:CxxxxCH/CxxCH domain c-type cytochrome n=1 Tax=Geopsychrobacter electrodiphilus TaxID=225196 RepID=UPI00035F210C|nr:CxxxxCH/CxxCH domain-containing protein [Geopsychrobacter electrodiphilus]
MKLKNMVTLLVLAVLMVAPKIAVARYVHDIKCDYCHKPSAVLNDVATNVCLDCHATGKGLDPYNLVRTAPGTISVGTAVFAVGDASNAMGHGAGPVDQTSHNWGASDTNAAAGASAPANPLFYGRSNYAGANVSCARCHDPHGSKDDVGVANPLLLKLGANSQDAMCLDCHRTWNKDSATNPNAWLTHPLEANYASYVDNVKFKPFTPDGGMTLNATGGMSCTTCHGTHYTDSDASTPDGPGLALNPNGFSNGRMLKGNGSLSTNKSSLCQSCHLYKSHGPTAKVGCLDCHSGHSYDPANPSLPNYFVLRSSINNVDLPAGSPAGVGTGNVTGLNYKTATADWFNAGGTGYCQNCHTIPVDGSGNHNGLASGGAAQCSTCHGHANTNGSFGGSCNTCHGYAPSTNTPGGPTGYAVNGANNYSLAGAAVFKDESKTPHAAHASAGGYGFSCDKCHPAGSATASHAGHNSGSFQEVDFGTTAGLARTKGMVPVYNPAGTVGTDKGTCSAVYCHSNGGARALAPKAANPGAWQNGSTTYAIAPTACNACHGNDATTMGAADKANSPTHLKHLAKGYSCSVCHKATADSATALAAGAIGGTHVNGTADVVFDGTSFTQLNTVPGVYGTDGTCQNLYCHSAGPSATVGVIPDWDLSATGACGTCHQVNATGDTGAALSGAHNTHVFSANGPKLACTTCHTNNGSGADHVNGFVSTVANLQTVVCDTCHGATAAGTGVDAEPVWITPASVTCRTCHQGTLANFAIIGGPVAPSKDSFDTTGHGKAGLTGAPDCTGCHDTTLGKHFDGISGDPQLTGGAVANTAFCQTCHTSSVHYANTRTAGGTSNDGVDCATCHNPHGDGMGTNSDAMILGTIAGHTVNNFTDKTARASYWQADNTGVCQVCHDPSEVIHFNRTTNENGTHFATSGVCTTCHKHTDTPIFKPNANSCGACHDALMATAPHSKHVNKLGGIIETDRSDCVSCHGAAVNSYTNSGGDINHQNGVVNFATGIADAGSGLNVSCSAACHSTVTGKAALWSDASLACTACHGNPPADGGGDSLAHSRHIAAGLTCATCHVTTPVDTSHITNTAGATDLAVLQNMAQALPAEANVVVSTWDNVNNTCANAACHNPSADTHLADWDTSISSCTLCHGDNAVSPATTGMVSGSHRQHLDNATTFGNNRTCTDCHADPAGNTAHRNGTLEVLPGLTYNGEVAIPSVGVGNCSTSQCHSSNNKGTSPFFTYAPSPTWGDNTAADKCILCHAKPPVNGDHQAHWDATRQANGMTCQSCHNGTATPGFTIVTGGGSHLNAIPNVSGFNDVSPGGSYNGTAVTMTYTMGTTGPSNCTASCHSDKVSPRDWAVASSCDACHSNLTADPTHAKHIDIAAGIQADRSECVLCHGAQVNSYALTGGGDVKHGNGTVDFAAGIADGGVSPNQTCTAACHGSSAADGFWGDTALNCTACHNNGTNDNNIANAAPLTGSHLKHVTTQGMQCADCHGTLPVDTSHISGLNATGAISATDGAKLTDKATPIADNATVNDSPFDNVGNTFDDVNNTCSNTYCHDPSNAGKLVTWGVDTASCTLCHGDGQGATQMATGTHANHLNATATFGLTITCTKCHPDNTGNNGHFIKTTGPTTVKQAVQFGGTVITGAQTSPVVNGLYSGEVALPNTAYGSCGTTACHNNGQGGAPNNSTYTWGTTNIQNCLLCHNNMPTTGGHATHLDGNIKYGPFAKTGGSTNCGLCHAANANNTSMAGQPTHINGTISFTGAKEVTSGAISGNTTVTACDLCHGGAAAVNLAVTGAKAVWSAGGPVACESCHGDYAQANVSGALAPVRAGAAYDTNGHGKPGVAKACVDCHNHAGDHIGYTTKRLNLISGKDFNLVPNDFCNACHTTLTNSAVHNANGASGTSNDALLCVTCHDQHGQNGGQDAMIASTIQTHTVSGFTSRSARASYANAGNTGVCQVCHDPNDPTATDGLIKHFNRTSGAAELATHNAGTNCTVCHSHTSSPIFKPSGCNGCHGGGTVGSFASNYWPDGNDGAAGPNDAGRHLTHMNNLAQRVYGMTAVQLLSQPTADAAQKALCEYCHAALTNDSDHGNNANLPAEVFVDKDGIRHAKSLWGAADPDATYTAGSCSNVDCHNSKVTGTGTFGWKDAGTTTCTMCHTPGAAGANPTTGLHTVTQAGVTVHDATLGAGCTECHNALPAIGNTAASTHINGSFSVDSAVNTAAERGISVAGNITSFTEAAVGTSDSCASNCHSDAGNWQRLWSTAADSTATALGSARCDVCHGQLNNWRGGMSVNHNLPKINDGTHTDCTQCHVAPNAPYSFATMHENGTVEINNNSAMSYNTTAGTCSVVACHGSVTPTRGPGASTIFTENLLNGPGASCNSCHLATGGSNNTNTVGGYTFKNRIGAHAKHVLSAATAYGSTATSTSAGSYNYGCGVCHPTNEGANHQDGIVELLLDPTSAPGTIKALNGAAAAYNGSTCTAVYCHGDGVTPGTSPNFLTGAFTNPNGDYCQNCHGNQPTTSSHAKHVVGIHYDDIYTGTSGLLVDGAASNAGHGDVTTAISITCALCHNATVNNWYNGNNTACVSCHGTLGAASNKTVLASTDLDKTLHVNGVKDVVFAPVDPIRSKAQIRELTPGEPELNNNWQRLNGYKVGATSHDETKVAAPLTAANWNGTTKNCTVACHNGNVATWGTTNVSCNACHTQLPK